MQFNIGQAILFAGYNNDMKYIGIIKAVRINGNDPYYIQIKVPDNKSQPLQEGWVPASRIEAIYVEDGPVNYA